MRRSASSNNDGTMENDKEDQEEESKDDDDDDEQDDPEWSKSRSRAIIQAGLLAGKIAPWMKRKQIFNMNPAVHGSRSWTYESWSNRLCTLRKRYAIDVGRMQHDCIAYGHDLAAVKAL